MSTYYSVNEVLKLKNEENYELIIGAIHFQYTLLGALMLNDDAKVFEMNLKADGKDYSFAGSDITPEFKKLLDTMRSAEEIELTVSYEYVWRAGYEHMNIGPFPVCELIEKLLDENAIDSKDFFYSMYNDADSEPGFGVLTAYGEKNGKQYCGVVELKTAEEFPNDGEWYAAEDLLFCCEIEESLDKEKVIIEACSAFDENIEYTLEKQENELAFELKNVGVLKTKEDFERLESLCAKLCRIAHDYSFIGQFIDYSRNVPRLMEFDMDENSGCSIRIASIKE